MQFRYFNDQISKAEILDLVPDHTVEYDDPVRAVLDGGSLVDGVVYQTGILVGDNGEGKLFYFYCPKTNRAKGQTYADAA